MCKGIERIVMFYRAQNIFRFFRKLRGVPTCDLARSEEQRMLVRLTPIATESYAAEPRCKNSNAPQHNAHVGFIMFDTVRCHKNPGTLNRSIMN